VLPHREAAAAELLLCRSFSEHHMRSAALVEMLAGCRCL